MRLAKYLEEPEQTETVKTLNGVTVCYQPQYEEKEWARMNFRDNYIYRRRRNVQIDFPTLKVVRHSKESINNPIYLD